MNSLADILSIIPDENYWTQGEEFRDGDPVRRCLIGGCKAAAISRDNFYSLRDEMARRIRSLYSWDEFKKEFYGYQLSRIIIRWNDDIDREYDEIFKLLSMDDDDSDIYFDWIEFYDC